MATDLEQLSVTLTAKIDDFKAGLRNAGQDFDQTASRIEDRNQRMTQTLSSQMTQASATTRLLTGALKGLISVYAFETLIKGAVQANEQLSKLSTTADRLKLSTDQLQSAGYAGNVLGGLSQADVGQGLEELRLRASKELREGEGELTRLFTANNLKLTDRNGKLKDGNQLLLDAATLVSKANSDLEKVEIAKILGLPTDQWIKALERGPDAIKKAEGAAKDAGAIIDKELVQRAKDFDDFWNKSFDSWAKKAKSTAVEVGGVMREAAALIQAEFERGTDSAAIGRVAARQRAAGNTDLAQHYERLQRETLTRRLAAGLPDDTEDPHPLTIGGGRGTIIPPKEKTAKADEFDREEKSVARSTRALNAHAEALKTVGEDAAKAEASSKLLQAAQEAGRTLTPALRLEIEQLAEAYAKAKHHVDALKAAQDLAFERGQLGRSADEQAVYSRLRGYGQDPNSEEGQRLADQIRQIQNLTTGKEMAGSFIKGLISDMENGVKAGKALENQLKRIADKLLDKALDSALSGLFRAGGGIFGDLFTPAAVHAQGGLAGSGPRIMVPASAFAGARHFAAGGGIPAILHAGEVVLNQAQQKNVAASMAPGPINLTHAPVFNGTGLSKEEVVAVGLQLQKGFARQIGPILSDWQRRHG